MTMAGEQGIVEPDGLKTVYTLITLNRALPVPGRNPSDRTGPADRGRSGVVGFDRSGVPGYRSLFPETPPDTMERERSGPRPPI